MHFKLLFGALAVAVAGCGGGSSGSGSDQPVSVPPPSIDLKAATSGAELEAYLKAGFASLNTLATAAEETAEDTTTGVTQPDSANGESEQSFSGTNVQEAGVDEGDYWKFNGEHFFYLFDRVGEHSQIKVVAAGEEPQALGEFDLAMSASELFLDQANLTAVGSQYLGNVWPTEAVAATDELANFFYPYQFQQVQVQNYRLAEVLASFTSVTPQLDIVIDGALVGSRKIDDTLYLVTRYNPAIAGWISYPTSDQDIASNAERLASVTLADLSPNITVNGVSQSLLAQGCFLPEDDSSTIADPVMTSITRVDLADGSYTSACVAVSSAGLYMTPTSAYVYRSVYEYWETNGPAVALADTPSEPQVQTLIHKVSLGETIEYRGSGIVDGAPSCNVSSFCFGELGDGSLAAITSYYFNDADDSTDHRLTILDANDLSLVSSLPNEQRPEPIGKPDELLYAARFMQDRAYLVTFDKVDPLYVIGLSDPSEPLILGQLEIPGFSDYLHPIGDSLVVGIGKDAITGDSGTTWYQGIKVDLFDVSDLSVPSQLESIILGRRGSNTQAAYDHHAIAALALGDQYRLVIPVRVHEGESTGSGWSTDPESDFFEFSHAGYQAFEIDLPSNGQASMTPLPMTVLETAAIGQAPVSYYGLSNRATIVADRLYYLWEGEVLAGQWQSTATAVPID